MNPTDIIYTNKNSKNEETDRYFTGLSRSDSGITLLDGQIRKGYHWYSVGYIQKWSFSEILHQDPLYIISHRLN